MIDFTKHHALSGKPRRARRAIKETEQGIRYDTDGALTLREGRARDDTVDGKHDPAKRNTAHVCTCDCGP